MTVTEATLFEQPKEKELEYRIIAVNKAGDGELSNTEMVCCKKLKYERK